MKIVFVTRNLWGGGAEKVISTLASEMTNLGNQVEILCLFKPNPYYSINSKVQINSSFSNFKNKLVKYIKISKYISTIKPDAIICMPEEIGIYLRLIYRGKSRFYTSERNDPSVFPKSRITRILRKIAYKNNSGIIFQTESQREYFSKIKISNSIIIENPIVLDSIPSRRENFNNMRIISAGRLDYQKNYSMLLKAFSIVVKSYPDAELTIYGDGPLRDKLLNEARTLLPNYKINFPGKTQNLLNEINNSLCFVLSSDYEGLPNVLIESLCIGVPCISTDTASGGPRSLIINGKNGFLAQVGNYVEIANGIIKILEMNSKGNDFEMNVEEMKGKYNSISVAQKWLRFIGK